MLIKNNRKILNKTFKTSNLKTKKKSEVTQSTKKTNLSKKNSIYNFEFNKLSKNERSKKEFEKANIMLQKKTKQLANAIVKKKTLTTKLMYLENEKKKSYWRWKLTSRYCAWRYLQKFKKPKSNQQAQQPQKPQPQPQPQPQQLQHPIEEKKIKNSDLVFWLKPPKTPLPIQLTELYPKTREQKIKNILKTHSIKKQIYYQLKQNTLICLLEKEKITLMLNTNLKQKPEQVFKTKKRRKKRSKKLKSLIKKRKLIIVFELKKSKLKKLRKKIKPNKKLQNLQTKNIANFISTLKTKNKWSKIKKILKINLLK